MDQPNDDTNKVLIKSYKLCNYIDVINIQYRNETSDTKLKNLLDVLVHSSDVGNLDTVLSKFNVTSDTLKKCFDNGYIYCSINDNDVYLDKVTGITYLITETPETVKLITASDMEDLKKSVDLDLEKLSSSEGLIDDSYNRLVEGKY